MEIYLFFYLARRISEVELDWTPEPQMADCYCWVAERDPWIAESTARDILRENGWRTERLVDARKPVRADYISGGAEAVSHYDEAVRNGASIAVLLHHVQSTVSRAAHDSEFG